MILISFFGALVIFGVWGILIINKFLGYFSIKDEKEKIKFKAENYPFFGLYLLTVTVYFQYFEFNSDSGINPFDPAFVGISLAVDLVRKMFLVNVFFVLLIFGVAFFNYIKLKKIKDVN